MALRCSLIPTPITSQYPQSYDHEHYRRTCISPGGNRIDGSEDSKNTKNNRQDSWYFLDIHDSSPLLKSMGLPDRHWESTRTADTLGCLETYPEGILLKNRGHFYRFSQVRKIFYFPNKNRPITISNKRKFASGCPTKDHRFFSCFQLLKLLRFFIKEYKVVYGVPPFSLLVYWLWLTKKALPGRAVHNYLTNNLIPSHHTRNHAPALPPFRENWDGQETRFESGHLTRDKSLNPASFKLSICPVPVESFCFKIKCRAV